QLEPSERYWMRKKAHQLRQQTQQRLQQAIENSGLSPSPSERQALFEQFWEERATIERELRKRYHEERQKKEEELIEKLINQYRQYRNSPQPQPASENSPKTLTTPSSPH
ncbi:MAG: hypothetical protein NZL93_05640, partial [Chthoniobacterales bacterium]|nr:hypothetical protein [Chthoniobacterales bacterium]